MLTLGIETSCDDTAAAVLQDEDILLANVVSSQDQIHTRFGGVVPELASRRHMEAIVPVVREALARAGVLLRDIDLIAVTQGPGLIGSLLVGFSCAKALSSVTGIPYVGVDHMAGHLLAIFLEEEKPPFPYIALIVSGGTSSLYLARSHTSFVHLGRTRDDAAGEAFDKVAKLLGLPYPGGPRVSVEAAGGNRDAIRFPRAWLADDSLDFSFSGLKTAVSSYSQQHDSLSLADVCASFQEAIVEVLVEKTLSAARQRGVRTVVLGGGVSANERLRQRMEERCAEQGVGCFLPRPVLCTDNAAMIALAGLHNFWMSGQGSIDQDVYSRSHL